jgi:uncharacterized protein YyaL (SSP411 family)
MHAFEATGDESYLDRAKLVERYLDDSYRNEVTGTYWDVPKFSTGPGFLTLKLRPILDNVRVAESLMDLGALTADDAYTAKARDVLLGFARSFGSSGIATLEYSIQTHRVLASGDASNAG